MIPGGEPTVIVRRVLFEGVAVKIAATALRGHRFLVVSVGDFSCEDFDGSTPLKVATLTTVVMKSLFKSIFATLAGQKIAADIDTELKALQEAAAGKIQAIFRGGRGRSEARERGARPPTRQEESGRWRSPRWSPRGSSHDESTATAASPHKVISPAAAAPGTSSTSCCDSSHFSHFHCCHPQRV